MKIILAIILCLSLQCNIKCDLDSRVIKDEAQKEHSIKNQVSCERSKGICLCCKAYNDKDICDSSHSASFFYMNCKDAKKFGLKIRDL